MTASRVRATLVICGTALVAGATGCSRAAAPAVAPAPIAASGATFRGVYQTGTDRSVFLPCGVDEQWYVALEGTPARELQRLAKSQQLTGPERGMVPAERLGLARWAYAEVRGDTIPLRAGTPMLPYDRELRVSRVVDVRPAQGGVCPRETTRDGA